MCEVAKYEAPSNLKKQKKWEFTKKFKKFLPGLVTPGVRAGDAVVAAACPPSLGLTFDLDGSFPVKF